MPAELLDKIYIAYNAPYALGNITAPKQAWAPVMPNMVRDDHDAKVFRFLGVMGCAQTAVGIVALGADQQTRAKLDVIGGATAIGIAGGLAQFDAEKDMGGPVKDVMKYGNIAANLAMGAMMIKRGMDNLDK